MISQVMPIQLAGPRFPCMTISRRTVGQRVTRKKRDRPRGHPMQRAHWVFVTNVDPSVASDAQRTHVVELVSALKAGGIAVTFMAPRASINTDRTLVPWMNTLRVSLPPTTLWRELSTLVLLTRVLRQRSIDRVYVRQGGVNAAALVFTRLLGIPCFLEVNGILDEEYRLLRARTLRTSLATWGMNLSARLSYALCGHVIAVTDGIRQHLIRRFAVNPQKISVIGNGANTERFVPLDRGECISKLKLKAALRYVGFIGSLSPWQGVEVLVRGFADAKLGACGVRLLIVGDGTERDTLQVLCERLEVSDLVVFTGYVPPEDVVYYFNVLDVSVAPFVRVRNENIGLSPLKVYEALACGKPVLASDVPGLDFISEQRVGLLCEPENATDLAKTLMGLLSLPEPELAAMGNRARELAEDRFSWTGVADRIVRLADSRC